RKLTLGAEDDVLIAEICRRRFRGAYGERLDGGLSLIRSQVETRMGDILGYHRARLAGITIQECEHELAAPLTTRFGTTGLKGKIDRIDRRSDGILILDYKTGAAAGKPNNGKFSLDSRAQWHKTVKSFQLPMYLILYRHNNPPRRAAPAAEINSALMLLGGTAIEEKPLFGRKDDREKLFGEYKRAITILIEEIMDPDVSFSPAPDPDAQCPNCGYKTPCGRQWMRAGR
ncbi:MAG: PD-(D/E)XK nuclease family protein, partial [Candidatus Edwardsbacteria bacterium]|nr:PD-(D/E)XK nuclease family protein [Candidatus Edwardsbacteria bacterium]